MAAAPSAETVPPTAGTVPDTAAPAAPAAPDAPVPAPGDVPRPPSRLGRRVPQLAAGLVLYGVSMGLMLRASLGGNPWDVLHQGLARHFGLSGGTWVTLVG